jgi:hypothetical protein
MRRFEIVRVSCGGCREVQNPKGWTGACTTCGRDRFRVVIERAASGLESLELEDFIRGASSDGPADPYWHTESFLQCSGISGVEIAEFCGAPIEERHRMYVSWKRRELESTLTPDQAVCGRCGVIFKIYDNAWNRSGYCSRSCGTAAAKSTRAPR